MGIDALKNVNLDDIKMRVVIDPGHGGKDSGAVGEYSAEKDLNLVLSKKLFSILDKDNRYFPILTRDGDYKVRLSSRVNIAKNENAEAFISIHCNASYSRLPHDCQVYFYDKIKDKPLGDSLFKYIDKLDNKTSKWSRVMYGNFYVLRKLSNTITNSVLLEIGFLSNSDDEDLLNDEGFQNNVCDGIYKGLNDFYF